MPVLHALFWQSEAPHGAETPAVSGAARLGTQNPVSDTPKADKPKHNADIARAVAREIASGLAAFCLVTPDGFQWPNPHLIAIAGSLRRKKAMVSDIELLFVPNTEERPSDLFAVKAHDLAAEYIDKLLADGVLAKRPSASGVFTWGEKNKLALHVPSGIPVDFFATTVENWWNSLCIRTGSKEMNIELTTGAIKLGRRLHAYGSGVSEKDGTVIPATSEKHVFELCGVPYREPRLR